MVGLLPEKTPGTLSHRQADERGLGVLIWLPSWPRREEGVGGALGSSVLPGSGLCHWNIGQPLLDDLKQAGSKQSLGMFQGPLTHFMPRTH